MPGVPGKTNNPHGAPRKDRALTKLLMTELSHTIDVDGKSISGKRLIAKNAVDAVTKGRVRFPNDTEDSVISVKDWIDFIKWLYVHIDGSVKTEVDVTSNGKDLTTIINVKLTDESDD